LVLVSVSAMVTQGVVVFELGMFVVSELEKSQALASVQEEPLQIA
jgi:hypothetical protein